jgi:hypothetical protein
MRWGALIAVMGSMLFWPAQALAGPMPLPGGDAGTVEAQDPSAAEPLKSSPFERRAAQWHETGEFAGPTWNCVGQYPEELGRAWAGWFGDLGVTPTTNQIYYVKAGWGVSGFPCGGGARVHVEMVLPAYTKLAISQQTPVRCFYDGLQSPELREFNQDCPQNPGTGWNGGPSFDPPGEVAWPTATGTLFEIWVPVKTTQHLNGLTPPDPQPCYTCLYVGAWMIDGYNSPWVYPKMPIYVAGSGGPPPDPSVNYPAPATSGPNTVGPGTSEVLYDTGQKVIVARLYANTFTEGTGGEAQFEMGNKEGEYNSKGNPIAIPTGGNWQAYEDWGMTPGRLYHWRLCYKPTSGDKVCGADQTINAPPETGIADSKINKSKRKATFFFGAPQVQNMTFTFQCKLDSEKFKPCESGKKYSRLAKGKHSFSVRAVDQDGHADATPAKETFKL